MNRRLTNVKEFIEIHGDDATFIKALKSNFRMREFLSSYGFIGSREDAETLIKTAYNNRTQTFSGEEFLANLRKHGNNV